ncbi:uncharacterized protein [Rutidosis leptorrhynchoides]|uniref:uncharacterized protein n=1 Tax=Rutidosis leptorrhynchoides TaxID=125765 RepID=UPI003A9A2A6E
MSWEKWDLIALPYDKGGLNVGSLKAKNLALLGKWWWKFKTSKDTLWIRIIKSIFGIEGGLGNCSNMANLKANNSTWKYIMQVGRDIDNLGINFTNSFIKKIADGKLTQFWKERWCGDQIFKDRFQRLFRLEKEQNATVFDRIRRVEDKLTFSWNWSRELSGRLVGELQNLSDLISQQFFNGKEQDSWAWSLSTNGILTTKVLSSLIEDSILPSGSTIVKTFRNKLVPSKVEFFVWRTRRKRIPVRVELDKRGIDLDSVRCPVCDEDIETVEHSIILCKRAAAIWSKVFSWWNLGTPSNQCIDEIFKGDHSNISSDMGAVLWQATKFGYVIWNHRNKSTFGKEKSSSASIFNEIQVLSHTWISSRLKKFSVDWHKWFYNPKSFVSNDVCKTGIG